jgi:hypothetical protein
VRLRPFLLVLATVAAASPLAAGYATRDAYLPIAGRASGAGGYRYGTTLWLTNPTDGAVHVKVTAVRAANLAAPSIELDLAPRATRIIDPLAAPLFAEEGFAALHIESSDDVVAHARLYTTRGGEPLAVSVASSFEAIPTQYAIGPDESAMLQGVVLTPDFRYKLYLIETAGHPLYHSLSLLDARGTAVVTARAYLGAHQHRVADLREIFPDANLDVAVLRITGINGNGRIIAGGVQVATASQDGTAYEMSFPTASRTRMSTAEVIAYVSVAVVVALALIRSLRARPRAEA